MTVMQITYASRLFIVMAAVFGAAAAVMYFTLDIKKCAQIVIGGAELPKTQKNKKIHTPAKAEGGQPTEKLNDYDSTKLLEAQDTISLSDLELVQDITMMIGAVENEEEI